MVTLCRFLSIYLSSGPEVRAEIKVEMRVRAEIGALKAVWVEVEVPLFLVGVLPASSFLAIGKEELRQAHEPVIWLAG